MPFGDFLKYDSSLSFFEKIYIQIFGVPINGLRIRARRIFPLINEQYKKILDAGCGPGIFSFELAKKLPESKIVGIDIEEKLLQVNREILQKTNLSNCSFEYQDIVKLSYINEFDLILSVDNLEHIEDDDTALRNFHTALKVGGTIIIHVPGYFRRWKFFGWGENFYVQGHFRPGYTREQLIEKVTNSGFSINEAYYTYGWIETITNNISYWITGAEMKNKVLYALVFPLLNFLSFFGKDSHPPKGAGVLLIAEKKPQ